MTLKFFSNFLFFSFEKNEAVRERERGKEFHIRQKNRKVNGISNICTENPNFITCNTLILAVRNISI